MTFKKELDLIGQRIESLGALLRKEEIHTEDIPHVLDDVLESLIQLTDLAITLNASQVDDSEEEDCCL